jgi:predicted site-specific integrase-resolvase
MSYTTLRGYVKRGYVKPVVLETAKWRFKEDVDKLMDTVRKRRVLYARVSSNTQRDDLVKGQIPTRIG